MAGTATKRSDARRRRGAQLKARQGPMFPGNTVAVNSTHSIKEQHSRKDSL